MKKQSYQNRMKSSDHMVKNLPPLQIPLTHLNVKLSGNPIYPDRDSIVLLSGGMDSGTLAYYVVKRLEKRPITLFVDYGQKTARSEWFSAITLSNELGLPFILVTFPDYASVSYSSILVGHGDDDSVKATVVPGRNFFLASLAVSIAGGNDISDVYIGVQVGDHEGYPDCRKEFWLNINRAMIPAYGIKIHVPFIGWSKKDIVKAGKLLGVDYSKTYSCYKRNDKPCGECPSCKLREAAGV